jgi:hypothetical protein
MTNPLILFSLQAVSIATIYCIWRAYQEIVDSRRLDLREKVAYMLWVAATRAD